MKSNAAPFQVSATNPDWQQAVSVLGQGLLPWQQDAFNAVKGARFSFVVAFMGSGKSYVQLTLGADEIAKSKYTQKQLIIVPQSHIHKGFVDETLHIKGKVIQWEVLQSHRFLSSEGMVQVIDKLKAWLLTPGDKLFKAANGKPSHLKGLTAVTSHSALALVWKKLSPAERKKAIHNLTLRVDEAHHINNILDIEEISLSSQELRDAEAESNNLGMICSYIMKSTDETAHLGLTTATPFRGDQDDILKKGAKGKFKTYYLPFFDHWKSLGIKNFGLEYLMYKGSPIKMCIDRILSEPDERHMVIVPKINAGWRGEGYDYRDLIKKLKRRFPGQVLDLVTKETQNENKKKLFLEPRKPQDWESKIRVIVTCMLGREGTDWCPCSRLHNLSKESSITLAVQTLGRPFRRFSPNKTEVHCFNYTPEFEAPDEAKSIKEVLSHRTNALLTCMIFDEGFYPILLPNLPHNKGMSKSTDAPTLRGLLDEQNIDYHAFRMALVALEGTEDFAVDKRTPESVRDAIELVMDEFGVEGNREAIFDGSNKLFARLWMLGHNKQADDMRVKGIDVSFLLEQGYDKLIEYVDDKDKSVVFTGAFAERDLVELQGMFKESFDERLAGLASRWSANGR